jgi:uncharacterized damage-inducible protein DinB
MPTSAAKAAPFELVPALLRAFDTNEKVNQFLLDQLAPEAWDAEPRSKKGRDVRAIVAHIHNVRVMWLKAAAKGSKIPAKLDRDKVTVAGAKRGLAESHEALRAVIEAALKSDGRIKGFRPDVASFIGYLIAHDAHHRGQVSMLARQAGHPLPQSAQFGMWEWGKLGSK